MPLPARRLRLACLALFLALGACGKKGPLYLPNPGAPRSAPGAAHAP